ncbi:hypothetical protein SAMN03080598_01411 [Algoriphagus boritolerans DSM 17298 = JCM 18970]|uniref:Uncharacterized protein n=1 Tax=Algoriphagus boritolerans DSM 17298 = JCM 18970 TaxID=1120964 RepID=A0A1H5UUT1_9BACT|nr:hypothetical protein SAMN03080598_01411 [Algoriphagus boritolerans DSM 17298 = JCM 18970]
MDKLSKKLALKILKKVFLRNGYVRIKDSSRIEESKTQKYKKGYEVRLVAKDEAELARIRVAIFSLDLYVAKSFLKGNQMVQPIYGEEITRKFEKIKRKSTG